MALTIMIIEEFTNQINEIGHKEVVLFIIADDQNCKKFLKKE